jgi:hypothetical protein
MHYAMEEISLDLSLKNKNPLKIKENSIEHPV